MYLTRTLENWFKEASRQFPVLLVAGARQVGKTTFRGKGRGSGLEILVLILSPPTPDLRSISTPIPQTPASFKPKAR